MATNQLDYVVEGDDFQYVRVNLAPGDDVRAEPGSFMWMEAGIEMETSTGGGLMAGLKRKVSGESFFLTTFTNGGRAPATSRRGCALRMLTPLPRPPVLSALTRLPAAWNCEVGDSPNRCAVGRCLRCIAG